MGQIVPPTVEAYLAGLNRLGDAALQAVAAAGAAGGRPVSDNVLWKGEVVPGFPPPPVPRHPAGTAAIAAYNRRLSTESRLNTAWLPLRDGVALSVKV